MRGTQRVGSLLRLFLCAAFLCLAWVLLTSSRADAAERPAPVSSVGSAVEPVKASVPAGAAAKAVAVQSRTATVPSPRPALRASVAAALPTSKALAPVVDRLRAKPAAGVDAGADGLTSLGAAVPLVEAPVAAVADAAVTLTDAVPVVGRHPLVDTRLPDVPIVPLAGTITGVDASEPGELVGGHAKPGAGHGNASTGAVTAVVPRGLALASFESNVPGSGVEATVVPDRRPSAAQAPQPSGLPEPLPSPQSPMPPAHPTLGGGGGGATGEVAAVGHAIVLLSPGSWSSSLADWRVPRGPSAQPGLRPD